MYRSRFIIQCVILSSFIILTIGQCYAGELIYPFGLSPKMTIGEAEKILSKQQLDISKDGNTLSINGLQISTLPFKASLSFKNNKLHSIQIRPSKEFPFKSLTGCEWAYKALFQLAIVKYGPPIGKVESVVESKAIDVTEEVPYKKWDIYWSSGDRLVTLDFYCGKSNDLTPTLWIEDVDNNIFKDKGR